MHAIGIIKDFNKKNLKKKKIDYSDSFKENGNTVLGIQLVLNLI